MENRQGNVSIPYEELSCQQKHILSIVSDHISKPEAQRLKEQLKFVIVGDAGSGKSTLILLIKALLDEKRLKENSFNFIISSFTGISSKQIHGFTLHHSFGLPLNIPTTKEERDKFIVKWRKSPACARLRSVQFIVIDELSFIGQEYFVLLEKLLRVANPAQARTPYAGKSILLTGDIYQLLPIRQRSLFHPCDQHPAYKLYSSLYPCFVLQTIFRQSGQSPEQIKYRQFLKRLRHNKCNHDDVKLLRTRREIVLPRWERDEFKDALRVFPYRREVARYNHETLIDRFRGKIIKINCFGNYLHLAVGAKVIFTQNVSHLIYDGVTNSTVGTVTAIIVKHGREAVGDFDVRDVVCIDVDIEIKQQIRPVTVVPSLCPNNCVPLALAYAVTIHRVQGLQLNKAVAHLDRQEFTTNSDYIIFSRVKRLNDVMIGDTFLDDDRLIGRVCNIGEYVESENIRLKSLQHRCYKEGNIVNYLSKRSLGLYQLNGLRC